MRSNLEIDVNVRCMEAVDLVAIRPRLCDGKNRRSRRKRDLRLADGPC